VYKSINVNQIKKAIQRLPCPKTEGEARTMVLGNSLLRDAPGDMCCTFKVVAVRYAATESYNGWLEWEVQL